MQTQHLNVLSKHTLDVKYCEEEEEEEDVKHCICGIFFTCLSFFIN